MTIKNISNGSRLHNMLKNVSLVEGFLSVFYNEPFNYDYKFGQALYEQGRQLAIQLKQLGYIRSQIVRKTANKNTYYITKPAADNILKLIYANQIVLI